jgi:hypothetical protein
MSYSRYSPEGKVYFYGSGDHYECCCCQFTDDPLGADGYTILDSAEEALEHLRQHENAGHNPSDRGMKRLEEEIVYRRAGWLRRVTHNILWWLEHESSWLRFKAVEKYYDDV